MCPWSVPWSLPWSWFSSVSRVSPENITVCSRVEIFGFPPSFVCLFVIVKIWSANCMCCSVNRNSRTGTNPFVIPSPYWPTFLFSSASHPLPSPECVFVLHVSLSEVFSFSWLAVVQVLTFNLVSILNLHQPIMSEVPVSSSYSCSVGRLVIFTLIILCTSIHQEYFVLLIPKLRLLSHMF